MLRRFNLTNFELMQLTNELAGVNGQPGLISFRMPVEAKYHLTELFNKVSSMIEVYSKMRDETIKNLSPDGPIHNFIIEDGKRVVNPVLIEFNKTMEPLDNEHREFKFRTIPLAWIKNLETEQNFPVLFKFLDAPEDDVEEGQDNAETTINTDKPPVVKPGKVKSISKHRSGK
jgi:hypothetical protein